MMKNASYFLSKALFNLKIFKFLFWLFDHVAKRLNKKDRVNFKFYDVTSWLTTQQAHNVYATLILGHIYVKSYMNVYTTLLQRM